MMCKTIEAVDEMDRTKSVNLPGYLMSEINKQYSRFEVDKGECEKEEAEKRQKKNQKKKEWKKRQKEKKALGTLAQEKSVETHEKDASDDEDIYHTPPEGEILLKETVEKERVNKAPIPKATADFALPKDSKLQDRPQDKGKKVCEQEITTLEPGNEQSKALENIQSQYRMT